MAASMSKRFFLPLLTAEAWNKQIGYNLRTQLSLLSLVQRVFHAPRATSGEHMFGIIAVARSVQIWAQYFNIGFVNTRLCQYDDK